MGNVTREFVFTLVRVKGNTINNHMEYLSPAQCEER